MKIFVLADPNGVILDFCPYIASGIFDDLSKDIRCMCLGASAVSLTTSIPPGTMLYFNRYFHQSNCLIICYRPTFQFFIQIIKTRLSCNISFQDDRTIIKNSGRGAYETFERQDKKNDVYEMDGQLACLRHINCSFRRSFRPVVLKSFCYIPHFQDLGTIISPI